VSRDQVPEAAMDNEKNIYREQIKDKPEKMQDQIISGKLEKYYEMVCLLDQPYVRDPDKKVKDVIAETVGKLGENIQVRRFIRFVLGAE
jgi:elongation factor Ts